ncbi:MAG: DUF4347 domain-containing protein, partial [Pseudomonadota bacterium]
MSKLTRYRRPLIEAIEPRLLFSATADLAVFDDGTTHGDYLAQAAAEIDLSQIYVNAGQQFYSAPHTLDDTTAESTTSTVESGQALALVGITETAEPETHSLLFVDTQVQDYQTLVKDILSNPANKNIEVIYLNAQQNGIQQISETLSHYTNISAIHLISHGVAGELQLGNAILNENTLSNFTQELHAWQTALTQDADILIYACDLAANAGGLNVLKQISQFTGADVAASDDATGSAGFSADWILEKNVGAIETGTLLSDPQNTIWQGALADVTYINTGAASNAYAFSDTTNVGQSFQYFPAGIAVDQISIQLLKDVSAASQTITLEIRSNSWNGTLVGTSSILSDTLSSSFQWVDFDFSEQTLSNTTVYYIKISSSGSDGLVSAAYHNSNVFNDGVFQLNGSGDAGKELAFLLTNANAVNSAPTNSPVTLSAIAEDSGVRLITQAQLLANASDVDGDTLTATGLTLASGTGNLVDNGNGTWNFTPTSNDSTGVSFSYSIGDGTATIAATATLDITPANDAPTNSAVTLSAIAEDSGV